MKRNTELRRVNKTTTMKQKWNTERKEASMKQKEL